MKVEIWSDVVCPWCYVGKRQFEEALSRFDHRDQVEVGWRSFELDPDAPTRAGVPMRRILERKYGMTPEQADAANRRMTELAAGVGLEYHLDDVQRGQHLRRPPADPSGRRARSGRCHGGAAVRRLLHRGTGGRGPGHVGRAGRRYRTRP